MFGSERVRTAHSLADIDPRCFLYERLVLRSLFNPRRGPRDQPGSGPHQEKCALAVEDRSARPSELHGAKTPSISVGRVAPERSRHIGERRPHGPSGAGQPGADGNGLDAPRASGAPPHAAPVRRTSCLKFRPKSRARRTIPQPSPIRLPGTIPTKTLKTQHLIVHPHPRSRRGQRGCSSPERGYV
jgi:hypothetical protein